MDCFSSNSTQSYNTKLILFYFPMYSKIVCRPWIYISDIWIKQVKAPKKHNFWHLADTYKNIKYISIYPQAGRVYNTGRNKCAVLYIWHLLTSTIHFYLNNREFVPANLICSINKLYFYESRRYWFLQNFACPQNVQFHTSILVLFFGWNGNASCFPNFTIFKTMLSSVIYYTLMEQKWK